MPEIAEHIDIEGLLEEALANFAALINDNDWTNQLMDLMALGRFQFLLRKQMRVEILGLRMALWRLALARSFPDHADLLFERFLHNYAIVHNDKMSLRAVTRAQQYWGMLQPAGDSDFNIVAQHLASFLELDSNAARKAFILKLALAIRTDYKYIFDRLI